MQKISKMRRADSAVFYCAGNRLPVYGAGAKQRKAKRFVAAYLRGTEISRNQGHYGRRSKAGNNGKCPPVIPADTE